MLGIYNLFFTFTRDLLQTNNSVKYNTLVYFTGGHMYTGGGECVLVKWTLANPEHKSFLPRLPAPIKHLTIAPDNLYVAVSTLDNGKIFLF